jgi:ParB family transcriptional regulator, chromosome partitioning protein
MESENLGKGLSALIPNKIKRKFIETETAKANNKEENNLPSSSNFNSEEKIVFIELNKLVPNSNQPRQNFKEEELESLAESIKENGLIQPIVVIRKEENAYEIIAGERRFKASKIAGLETIPAIVKRADGLSKLELALIENIQRENLNPIEEGRAYQKLIKEFHFTQEDISKKIKKGRSTIANLLRFLRLPEEVQQGLIEDKINEGHAKIISALDDPENQLALYKKIVKDNLTVRDTENITSKINVKAHQRNITIKNSPLITQREKILSDILGLKVKIKNRKKGGKIILEYYDENDLERLIQFLDKKS